MPRLGVYLKARAGPAAEAAAQPEPAARVPALRASTKPGDVLEVGDRASCASAASGSQTYDGAVGAERGYLREAGNLLFHFSLILALVGVAWGSLFGYRGTVLVVVGNGFSNSLAQYDDFTPGRAFNGATTCRRSR